MRLDPSTAPRSSFLNGATNLEAAAPSPGAFLNNTSPPPNGGGLAPDKHHLNSGVDEGMRIPSLEGEDLPDG